MQYTCSELSVNRSSPLEPFRICPGSSARHIMKLNDRSFRLFAGILVAAGCLTSPLRAAEETELKDEAGKVIARYAIEVPPGIAQAGTTDPAKQVGLIFCFQEHGTP